MHYRIGIDTGGTYTDAVLMDAEQNVVRKAKALTTRDNLAVGISEALSAVLPEQTAQIDYVSLSTTLATNGMIENQGGGIALVLIGFAPDVLQRAGLAEVMNGNPVLFVEGGHDANGQERQPLDVEGLKKALDEVSASVDAIAVSAFFATRNPKHELQARQIISEQCGLPVSCGHELSARLDAPRRALTAAINARLIPLIQRLMQAAQSTLAKHNICAPLMVVKGDGSLISAAVAAQTPVETILSGPAASVIGARFLTGDDHLIVADMGGTTSDIAFLDNGQPRLSADGAAVGGYRTMVHAVHVHTFGLGGDSWVYYNRDKRDFDLGPRRVVPLVTLAAEYPQILEELALQQQRGWSKSYDAIFIQRRPDGGIRKKMSSKQRDLWDRIGEQPKALQSLFDEQTMDRALERFMQRDWVRVSAFTPTDAAHILGLSHSWSPDAARIGGEILARYARGNQGPELADAQALAQHVRTATSQSLAQCVMAAALAEELDCPLPISAGEQALIDIALGTRKTDLFEFRLRIERPLLGIGAPVGSYFPDATQQLGTQFVHPEHAEVANAIGAIVGLVRCSAHASITPIAKNVFRLHGPHGYEDFGDLEQAVEKGFTWLVEKARQQAQVAGADTVELTRSRDDNIVEGDGESVFFESQLQVHAIGRPAAAQLG